MSQASKETMDDVLEIYNPYLSAREMGKLVGKSFTTVRAALIQLGLPTKRRFKPPQEIPELSTTWAAEFRGFFYADGYAGLDLKANENIAPVMIISQRADNKPILEDIEKKLGGNLSYTPKPTAPDGYVGNPQWKWRICSWSPCYAVLKSTDLAEGLLPASKKMEMLIFRDAIRARFNMPRDRLTKKQKEELLGYRKAIMDAKKFQL